MQKEENSMKFDIVIGNPPYNNDIYLDFINMANKLSRYSYSMIIPAKWQIKGGDKNEIFRKYILPFISDLVYYPNSKDVFNIDCQGGVCYFAAAKEKQIKLKLSTLCKDQKLLETDGYEQIDITDLIILYNNTVRNIIKKLGTYDKLCCMNKVIDGNYNVAITNVYSEKSCTSKSGSAYVTIKPYITTSSDKKNEDTSFLNSFDTEDEAKSYISYLETKFIRFMFLLAKTSLHMQSDNAWNFIPNPGSFDHIFTDDELYKKYNLDQDEINIIKSVIKERK